MSIPEVRIAVAALRVALAKGIVTPEQAAQVVLTLQKDSQVTWPGGASPSTQMLMQQTPRLDTSPSTIQQRYHNNVLYGSVDAANAARARDAGGPQDQQALTNTAATTKSEDKPTNKPFRTPGGPKKFAVYVKDGDSKKKVTFGDPNMEIKRDSPERRKNFRARHNCENPGPKTKARYWSCRMWSKSKVSSVAKRCWDGYEPTPGKKAYSKGSCRPKA